MSIRTSRWSGITSEDRYYRRSEWFDCACCPPNLARLWQVSASYFYSTTADTLYVHLYNQNRRTIQIWAGAPFRSNSRRTTPGMATFTLSSAGRPTAQFDLALRIPGWCRNLSPGGERSTAVPCTPYERVRSADRRWARTAMRSRCRWRCRSSASWRTPDVRQDAGCIALQRGPVVYCLEEVDNGPQVWRTLSIPRDGAARRHNGHEPVRRCRA